MKLITLLLVCSIISRGLCATSFVVSVSNLTHPVSPSLFGIFFEEINHAGEGGLYGELVANRGFDSATSLGAAQLVSLSPAAFPTYYVRHCDYIAYISPIGSTQDDEDSTFSQTTALNGNSSYISFESTNYPGYYLRHYNFRLILATNDNSQQFAADASFRPVKALDGSSKTSFESFNYPGHYLIINGSDDGGCTLQPKYDIYLVELQNTASYHTNATFLITSPNMSPYTPWVPLQENGAITNFTIDDTLPLNSQSTFAGKIVASGYSSSNSYSGIANSGFWGINAQPGDYQLSFFSKVDSTFHSNAGDLLFSIESADGTTVYGKLLISVLTTTWSKRTGVLTVSAGVSDANARLAIRLTAPGTVWVDVVSLFPENTYKGRTNGIRNDLANLLEDLAPAFVRFPGGCYVEGSSVKTAFLWKNSTGPIEQRPGHDSFWGYWSTDGLGYLEYLQLCEDLGAAPVFVLHIGIFTGDTSIPFTAIEPWIQDALDAIEYATGSTSTTWGAKRAQDGHATPFSLETVALGNENGCGFDTNGIYVKYYTAFATRIKAAYPSIKLIANCDISKDTNNVDLFDVHLYNSPTWFVDNAKYFDTYSRTGPKAFVSEYAVTSDCGDGNLQAAVAEAAFITGLIRNSDVVALASYAPLFVNVNNRAWNPDAIQFDSAHTAPTPSYYVQQLFSKYTGTYVAAHGLYDAPAGLLAVASYDKSTSSLFLPIVNFAASSVTVPITLQGTTSIQKTATTYVLSGTNPNAENTIANPNAIVPSTTTTAVSSSFSYIAPPYSVSILVINTQ